MQIHDGNTQICNDQVARCEDLDQFKEIIDMNSQYYRNWKLYINRLVEVNHLNYVQMGDLCMCSKNTVKRWCNEGKIPQNRETFLKIALGLRMNLEETNHLLRRYGKYPGLYPKCLEDAICIYAINNPISNKKSYVYYQELKQRYIRFLHKSKIGSVNNEVNTQFLSQELNLKNTEADFELFIEQNEKVFQNSYHKLLSFIEMFIKAQESNMHEFVKEHALNAAFDKMLSQLRNKKEVPRRMKLIILGVHLNMSLEQLNEMLSYAYMEPICAKDKIESAVLYAVENAYLNNPSFAYENALGIRNFVDDDQVKRKYQEIIEDYWVVQTYNKESNIEEYNHLDEGISDYLKWILEEIKIDDPDLIELL